MFFYFQFLFLNLCQEHFHNIEAVRRKLHDLLPTAHVRADPPEFLEKDSHTVLGGHQLLLRYVHEHDLLHRRPVELAVVSAVLTITSHAIRGSTEFVQVGVRRQSEEVRVYPSKKIDPASRSVGLRVLRDDVVHVLLEIPVRLLHRGVHVVRAYVDIRLFTSRGDHPAVL